MRIYCAGDTAGRSVVGAVPIKRGPVVSAARILASLQRRRAHRSDPHAPSASTLGAASANHHGQAQSGGGGRQTLARHPAKIQGGYGRSCGIRLHEGHRSLPPRLAILFLDLSCFTVLLFYLFLSIFDCKLYSLSARYFSFEI